VCSIKRILNTNTFIIKTLWNGLKSLTIKNLIKSEFSVKNLLEAKEDSWNNTASLQFSNAPNSHLMIATTQNEEVKAGSKLKRSIVLMKINIAGK
jgi:hypothetical protein